jgi:myo-inositol-1(or 4)-monophosphatase
MTNRLDPTEILPFIEEITRSAGEIILGYYERDFLVHAKATYGSKTDIVTEADRASEDLILKAIGSRFPDHDIVSEETATELTGSRRRWFVDPLDGTVNFAHGYPFFTVSVALMEDDELIVGVVRDPLRNETYAAMRGLGAFRNGRRISVSKAERLERSVVSTGFPYDKATSCVNNLTEFCRVLPLVQGVRRAGSAALDLSYVACGRLDGFWEFKLKSWDIAAGMLIVKEAGGTVSDVAGHPIGVYTPSIVATNGLIHADLSAVVDDRLPQL